jgi:phosphoserine aminotransferase
VNFSPGPSALPLPVLEEAQATLVTLPEVGASPLEVSHRGSWFTGVIEEAEANLRELLAIPETHRVCFLQGGATLQFSMVPMNLLRGTGRAAAYVVTGSWSEKAVAEAEKEGRVRIAWTGREEGFVRVPDAAELDLPRDAAYAHVTTNETIQGVEFREIPAIDGAVPLVADASSDLLSRPMDLDRFGLLYGGAQKNAGPAGLTIVIVRDDLLERIPDGLGAMLDYRTFVRSSSLYNTPPVFAIYVVLLVTRWLRDEIGGLKAMADLNEEKASTLYSVIDEMPDVYRGHADPGSRSRMNVTFRTIRLPAGELDRAFVEQAEREGMIGLKGHRSVGGIRASIYNAVPLDGVRKLAAFMREFAAGIR